MLERERERLFDFSKAVAFTSKHKGKMGFFNAKREIKLAIRFSLIENGDMLFVKKERERGVMFAELFVG